MRHVQVSGTEVQLLQQFRKLPKSVKRAVVKPMNTLRLQRVHRLQTPEVLILYVLDSCNLRCKHCFYWKEVDNPRATHSLEELEKLAKSLKEPLELLTLTGGEPFLRKDLAEIVDVFVKHAGVKRIHIASNGFTSSLIVKKVKDMLAVCSDARLTLQFSLDGFEEIHDRLRGRKGSFRNVCESARAVNAIKDSRLAVSVATVVFQQNYSQMKDLKKYVNEDIGVPLKFNILRKTSSVRGVPQDHLADMDIRDEDYVVPTKEQLLSLPDLVDDGSVHAAIERMKIEHSIKILEGKPAVDCLAGIRDAVIFSNGDVGICEPTTPFANLKEYDYDFYKLWTSEKAKEKKAVFLGKCFCLQSCNLLNAMKYDAETLVQL